MIDHAHLFEGQTIPEEGNADAFKLLLPPLRCFHHGRIQPFFVNEDDLQLAAIDLSGTDQVIGQRGKTINEIIARTGVKIDITDDGKVSVCGEDQDMIAKAVEMVNIIVSDFEKGQVFTGKVVSIKEFGAFVEFAPGKEGMVHISKISKERIDRVEDVLTLGDTVKVVCLGKDKMGRISFSIKDAED